jgi:hypothetical protein
MCKFIYLFYNTLKKWSQLKVCIKISTHGTFNLIFLWLKYSMNFFTQFITIFLFFHIYSACNYIPHNAFFMNPIKGIEITFKFKQMYEKKINNIYFYFFMFNMKKSIKFIFHDSKQGIKHCIQMWTYLSWDWKSST